MYRINLGTRSHYGKAKKWLRREAPYTMFSKAPMKTHVLKLQMLCSRLLCMAISRYVCFVFTSNVHDAFVWGVCLFVVFVLVWFFFAFVCFFVCLCVCVWGGGGRGGGWGLFVCLPFTGILLQRQYAVGRWVKGGKLISNCRYVSLCLAAHIMTTANGEIIDVYLLLSQAHGMLASTFVLLDNPENVSVRMRPGLVFLARRQATHVKGDQRF